jgi:hypothetical protein
MYKFMHENTSFYFILNLLVDRSKALVYECTPSLGGRLHQLSRLDKAAQKAVAA